MERQQADGFTEIAELVAALHEHGGMVAAFQPTRRFVPESSTWPERRAFYMAKEHARRFMEAELHASVALVTVDGGAELGHRVYKLGMRLIESLLGPDDRLNLITEILTVYHDEVVKGGAA